MEAITSTNDVLVEDKIATLEDREVLARQRFEEILDITRLVVKYSLRDVPDAVPDRPQTLIRMFTGKSHTSYSNDFGFYCSNSRVSEPPKDLSDLMKDAELLRQSLRKHCEGTIDPSDWISLILIPKALKFIEKRKLDQDSTC